MAPSLPKKETNQKICWAASCFGRQPPQGQTRPGGRKKENKRRPVESAAAAGVLAFPSRFPTSVVLIEHVRVFVYVCQKPQICPKKREAKPEGKKEPAVSVSVLFGSFSGTFGLQSLENAQFMPARVKLSYPTTSLYLGHSHVFWSFNCQTH